MPSESKIIEMVRRFSSHRDDITTGIGDDAAVLRIAPGRELIACCDLSVEEVHFRRDWATALSIGRKALAVTLSDVAAMGGVPLFALVSLAVPADSSEALVDELIRGLFDQASEAGVAIVGGDTSSSPGSLFIDTGVIGDCEAGKHIRRSGARQGDQIWVSGRLGLSALGLELLKRGVRLNRGGPCSATGKLARSALKKHLDPVPRLELGRRLGESGLVTSMIDISDGLSTDLTHILEESKCGAVVEASSVPLALSDEHCSQIGITYSAMELALNSGEEYELLFTAPAEAASEVRTLGARVNEELTAIGQIVNDPGLRLSDSGELRLLQPAGYEHFR